ncbi:conserved hypothetical protein [Candidatus Nitrosotenuis uzonensis]|uniref:Uncharacterized protein n=2 Tax=Candidatus Nitrosotenuis uzonensis TaxID=1407055 RepID=A0A812EZ98_9ARCH|nr:conserved hypothetical protein [Candidatus Nitrosotenuis uzonensis]
MQNMKLSKKEVYALTRMLEKILENREHEKVRILQRRKAQLRGKAISRIIKKSRKPIVRRRPAKRRVSIR